MELRFSKIASVEFRHDYFLQTPVDWNTDWPSLYTQEFIPHVFPSQDTARQLANYGMRLRKSNKGFDIYAEVVEDAGKWLLKKKNTSNFKLVFYCESSNSSWWNYTRVTNQNQGICYFSNLLGLKTEGIDQAYYLHNEIIQSAAGIKVPASLVRKNNHVYEAVQRTNTQPPGAHWQDLGIHKNYTTLVNQLPVLVNSVDIFDADLAGKTIEIKDVYDAVVFSQTVDPLSTLQSLNIDLQSLSEGLYAHFINGVKQATFYHAKKREKNAFGCIEIYFQGSPAEVPASQQLANEWLPIGNGSGGLQMGEINPRKFVIHFLPNRAKWKYIMSKDIQLPAPDIAAAGYQKLDDTTFLSNETLPLTRAAKGADFGLENAFPAPGINLLKTLKNGSDEVEFYVSEIFVNV